MAHQRHGRWGREEEGLDGSCRRHIVQGRVDTARITTLGFGADKPIACNDTEEGKAKNRRTELVFLKK